MSERVRDERAIGLKSAAPDPYEAPLLTPIGNARDLLAGADGSITDGFPTEANPNQPT